VQHCDDETLALLALGEAVDSAADTAHLQVCARCRDELEALRVTVAAGRSTPQSPLVAPPARVWAGIADELALDRTPPAPVPLGARPDSADGAVSRLVPRQRRVWRTAGLAMAACLAGLLVGVAGTVALSGDDDDPADAVVVARTPLQPLPAKSGGGEARLAGTGVDRTLVVDVTGIAADAGFHEVWVLDPATLQMQSLGVLRGSHGEFAVPPGLDLRRLSVVDVSLEPYDGNPAHSRNSLVRGALRT
jgi:hypothetical protein